MLLTLVACADHESKNNEAITEVVHFRESNIDYKLTKIRKHEHEAPNRAMKTNAVTLESSSKELTEVIPLYKDWQGVEQLTLTMPMLATREEQFQFLSQRSDGILRVVGEYPIRVGGLFEKAEYKRFIDAGRECSHVVNRLKNKNVLSTDFENACLTRRKNIPDKFSEVVGLFTHSEKQIPFCGGTIISSRHILTAKHCFLREKPNSSPRLKDLKKGNIIFHFASPRSGTASAKVASSSLDQATPYNGKVSTDYVLVELDADYTGPVARLEALDVKRSIPFGIWLIGSIPTFDQMGSKSAVLDYVKATRPDKCAVVFRDNNGCIYHSCQSRPSTSGSGLLLADKEGVLLLGVHGRASDLDDSCDAGDYKSDLVSGKPILGKSNVYWKGFNLAAAVTIEDVDSLALK
ncbi:MAG: trypsin-like serine protease [Pseudomonadota bacterium]